MPVFREILKKAWVITWRHKFLWIFGFFVALLSGGGEFEILFKNYESITQYPENLSVLQNLYQTGFVNQILVNFKFFFTNHPIQALAILLIFLAIAVIVIWLVIISQVALIFNIKEIGQQRQAGIGFGYRAGKKFFWNVLILNIVAKVFIYGLLLIMSLPLITFFLVRNNFLGAIIFIFIAFLILLPLNVIISFIIKYAIFYLVIGERKFWQALKEGRRLFLKNWLISLELAAIILIISFLASLALVILIILVIVPFVLLAILSIILNTVFLFSLVLIIGLLLVILITAVAGAIFSTFQYSSWVLLFFKLTEGQAVSKIVRIFSSFSHRFVKK